MAAGVAARTLKVRVVTVETVIHIFLPTGVDDELTAEASLLHAGRKLIHAEVQVTNREGDLVAKGGSTLYVTGEDTGVY